MSWIDVVGMKRVELVDRYEADELVVWIPNPRKTNRDSSERVLARLSKYSVEVERNISICTEFDIPVYPLRERTHKPTVTAPIKYNAGIDLAADRAVWPTIDCRIAYGISAHASCWYMDSHFVQRSRIKHEATIIRADIMAWWSSRAVTVFKGARVETVKETVVGVGR